MRKYIYIYHSIFISISISELETLYLILCTVNSVHCIIYIVHYIIHTLQYTLTPYSVNWRCTTYYNSHHEWSTRNQWQILFLMYLSPTQRDTIIKCVLRKKIELQKIDTGWCNIFVSNPSLHGVHWTPFTATYSAL